MAPTELQRLLLITYLLTRGRAIRTAPNVTKSSESRSFRNGSGNRADFEIPLFPLFHPLRFRQNTFLPTTRNQPPDHVLRQSGADPPQNDDRRAQGPGRARRPTGRAAARLAVAFTRSGAAAGRSSDAG